MDKVAVQNAIGKQLSEEVKHLETILFGSPRGGWPETGLNLAKLKQLVELKLKKAQK